MLADQLHRAGLGALVAFALGRHVAHLLAPLELLEIGIHQAVLVEVDLAAVRRLDEAVALIAEQAVNLAVRRTLIGLYPPGPLAGMVLQPAPGGHAGVDQVDVAVLIAVALPTNWCDPNLISREPH